MRLRQVALVARELAPVRESFFDVLGLQADFNDPGVRVFGLENSVMALQDTFLEVVAPVEADTAAGRFLARRGGEGGYMVIVQTDNLRKRREKVDQLGLRVAWEVNEERAAAFHIHPRDVGGAILSFDQMWPPESWQWGGPEWERRAAANVSKITAVDVQSSDPEAMALHWSQVFDQPVFNNVMQLDDGRIRFVRDQDGRGDGIAAVDLSASNPDLAIAAAHRRGLPVTGNEVLICGTIIRLT